MKREGVWGKLKMGMLRMGIFFGFKTFYIFMLAPRSVPVIEF